MTAREETAGKIHNSESSCDWGFSFQEMKDYHDTEWGVPLHDDQKQLSSGYLLCM